MHKSILLLDDDNDDCTLFQEALYEVDRAAELWTANSFDELMAMLRGPGQPDLIVMDLNMPKLNGIECLARLKATERLKDIPVVIFSTIAQQDAVERVYRNGALHYITKPYTFQVLKQIVARLLSMDLRKKDKRTAREKFLIEL